MSAKFHGEDGNVIPDQEVDHSREDYLARAIVSQLGDLFSSRANDLPHRFRAPARFAEYLEDYGTNSNYYTTPIHGSSYSNPMTLAITTRPTQKILELIFQAADGTRLFTLEIEYSAIPEKG